MNNKCFTAKLPERTPESYIIDDELEGIFVEKLYK